MRGAPSSPDRPLPATPARCRRSSGRGRCSSCDRCSRARRSRAGGGPPVAGRARPRPAAARRQSARVACPGQAPRVLPPVSEWWSRSPAGQRASCGWPQSSGCAASPARRLMCRALPLRRCRTEVVQQSGPWGLSVVRCNKRRSCAGARVTGYPKPSMASRADPGQLLLPQSLPFAAGRLVAGCRHVVGAAGRSAIDCSARQPCCSAPEA
ncbi:MAG: hypothetical protein FAZ92_00537 [Accumulibacter sp.]|nr:MAG: hypothetical protein FAZ92_00537 [Accumulibacter sp.]